MYSLISFATQWGSKHGGINSFNTDFLTSFGIAYYLGAQVICIVASANEEEIKEAHNAHVTLVPLPYAPQEKIFSAAHAKAAINELKQLEINFDPENTIWLGHDRITGAAAIEAAKIAGGRSALIHHMSYAHYESYAEDSETAYAKEKDQSSLFQQADIVLAIGPLLRDALHDLISGSTKIHMLIPGLAEIEVKPAPKTFTAFLSGRLSDDAARIKQGHLGIAAFAKAHRNARENKMPDGLSQKPKLVLRGVDFDSTYALSQPQGNNPESELKKFAEEYAQGVINLQALPYTQNRQELYDQLSATSVALMPSWHEGFGLTGWEAIAAGVPLIVSKDSGVYRLLDEELSGSGTGAVYPIDVDGSVESPFFSEKDLQQVAETLKEIAYKIDAAQKQAGILRERLSQYTWPACAEKAKEIFEWEIQKGSIPETKLASKIIPPNTAEIPADSTIVSPLHIPSKHWQAGGMVADSLLLRAEEALVPFDPARQPDLDNLNVWLDNTQYPQAARLITGAGGLGKTRLALELCQQRLLSNWHAGLLDADLEAKDIPAAWLMLRNFNQPLLIVIDYAETRQETLLALIKSMLNDPGNHPVRLLLLARDGGEWWDNLPGKDKGCESFLDSYATSGPHRLPALHIEIQDRQQAYQLALNVFSKTLQVPAPEVIPELAGDHFGRPLYLQMAALLALHGERPTTAQGLTKALLHHERRYWRGTLMDMESTVKEPERYAEQLLALTTLVGGFSTPKDAQSYWNKASGQAIGTADFNHLFHALEPLYPGKQGLQAVKPDLLGEALVAQALLRSSATDLLDAVLGSNADKSIHRYALTVLARLSEQHHDLYETLVEALACHFSHCCREIVAVATETSNNLPALAEAAFTRLAHGAKSQVTGLLESYLQDESVQLGKLYSSVSEVLLAKARKKLAKKPNNTQLMYQYTEALDEHSLMLYRIGDNNQALSLTQEAIETHEYFLEKNLKQYKPSYAALLSNYASLLSEVGQYEEAQKYGWKVLEIHQLLAENKPDRYESDYAGSLVNYASFLHNIGQREDAYKYAWDALEIFEGLSENNPDRYEPDYALSLSNYASLLSEVGQYEGAQKYGWKALEIRQRLAENNPDRHEPDYAASLINYTNRLNEAGKYEEEGKYAWDALEIHKRLSEKNPDRYEPVYAKSLSNYASFLSEVGKDEEARKYAWDALAICKRLSENNPDRYEPDYAISLSNYANRLSEIGQDEEARQYAWDALAICKRLSENNPDRYEPDYALSLSNYASHLSDAGQDEEARQYAWDTLEIRKRLSENNPNRHEPDYATSLSNYAGYLSDVGQDEEARQYAWDALAIRKRLSENNPDRYESNYAISLSNYANRLSEIGQDEEARQYAWDALEIRKRLSDKNSDRYEPDYAVSLSNYANRLSEAGQDEEALEYAWGELEILKRLAKESPHRFAANLFSSACNTHFLEWLSNHASENHHWVDLEAILEDVPQHRRSELLLYKAFVQACQSSSDPVACAEAFKQALTLWNDLSKVKKLAALDYWLCATAWCAKFDPSSVENLNWHTEWRQFINRRNGRLPCWMQKVADRLNFQWPTR